MNVSPRLSAQSSASSAPPDQQSSEQRISALTSSPHDPSTLVLLADPSHSSGAAFPHHSTSIPLSAANIATATANARATPTFAGSGFFAAAQDPSKHLAQLPLETPYFTPQAVWTETSRSDYFSTAANTPAIAHLASPHYPGLHPSQANLFSSGFALPAQTPAAIEIPSFASSSPSYFPDPSSFSDQEQQSFHLPPSSMPPVTQSRSGSLSVPWEPYPSKMMDRNGASASIPVQKPNLSIPMQLSSLMSPPSAGGGVSSSRLSMSALSQQSHHHHIAAASAAPTDLSIQQVSCETLYGLLAKVVQSTDKNAVMVLDMRPSVSHAASSIKTAVSVCIPNMLLKRPMYSLQMVTEQLTTELDVETFSRWKQFAYIVLFDAGGAAPVVGSPAFFLAQKFRKEGCNATLGYLHGGFSEFSARYGDLCRTDEMPNSEGTSPQRMSLDGLASSAPTPMSSINTANNNNTNNSTKPMSIVSPARPRLHLGSLPSMMTQPSGGPMGCQTPMIENPNVNPLFESVRQAMGLSTNITEEIPVRLPMGFSAETMHGYMPRWLTQAILDGSGKARLSEFFQKVEINENKRLALVMLPQNLRTGRITNVSIGAGIEQGLKNRYNNVWPYDHTRVKISEVDQGHDDYINASFLTPLFSRKTYIATQGPLPSTFQDFWKMTWEQSSRVVVMLTREEELGRIKCHEYWPTARQPVMDVGVMRVTFVTEFLPDLRVGTILVRELRLRHMHRPEAEERTITQIQYSGWPDFGVPETPLEVLSVIRLANKYNTPEGVAGPMVVHCSAGCGRTGAFCVIDSILTELEERSDAIMQPNGDGGVGAETKPRPSLSSKPSLEFSRSGNDRVTNAMTMTSSSGGFNLSGINSNNPAPTPAVGSNEDLMADIVYTSVSTFREQRLSMVQTLRQYVFCYEAIFWHLAQDFAMKRPGLGLTVVPQPSSTMAVHTPLLTIPPSSMMTSNPTLSMGNAPITTTSEEISFFG